jgi:hypothetical protein
MNRSWRPPAVACLLLAVAIIVTGCGSADDPSGEPDIGELLTVEDMASFRLPLDDYHASGRDLQKLATAETLLVNQCLGRYGLELPPREEPAEYGSINARRYGITDAAQAAERGYHGPAPSEDAPTAAATVAPEVEAVVTGQGPRTYEGQPVPQDGCIGEARRELANGTDPAVAMDLGESLAGETWQVSKEDSRVRSAFSAWSACMTRAGYDYADPFRANDDPAFGTAEPTPDEIAVATADVRCKREANVVNVWATVETAYQQRAIEENAEPLAVVRRNFEITEGNATAVLSAAGQQ